MPRNYTSKYRGMNAFEQLREYARLKNEWHATQPWDEKAYNAFIARITKELRI